MEMQIESSGNTIDKKELRLMKVEIQQNARNRNMRDSNNLDKIILPRRDGKIFTYLHLHLKNEILM